MYTPPTLPHIHSPTNCSFGAAARALPPLPNMAQCERPAPLLLTSTSLPNSKYSPPVGHTGAGQGKLGAGTQAQYGATRFACCGACRATPPSAPPRCPCALAAACCCTPPPAAVAGGSAAAAAAAGAVLHRQRRESSPPLRHHPPAPSGHTTARTTSVCPPTTAAAGGPNSWRPLVLAPPPPAASAAAAAGGSSTGKKAAAPADVPATAHSWRVAGLHSHPIK